MRRIEDADARPPHLRRDLCVGVAQGVAFFIQNLQILPGILQGSLSEKLNKNTAKNL